MIAVGGLRSIVASYPGSWGAGTRLRDIHEWCSLIGDEGEAPVVYQNEATSVYC